MATSKKPSSISVAAQQAKDAPSIATEAHNQVDRRIASISDTQRRIKTQTLHVDPATCVVSTENARFYEDLNEQNCADLIETLLSQGRQSIPAIVRPLAKPKAGVKYEVVDGARRLWAINWLRNNNYPEFDFLVDVKRLTDEEAFRLSLIGNVRKDESAYEKGANWRRALKEHYNGKQSDMAKRIGQSPATLSKHLKLAELPIEIADAFAGKHDLKLVYADELLRLLADKASASKVLHVARELRHTHAQHRLDRIPSMSGAEVFKRLKAAGVAPRKSARGGPIKTYGNQDSPHLTLKNVNPKGLNLYVSKSSGADIESIIDSVRQCLSEYYKG